MDDGWGLHFVRRTRKSELSGRNQSPFGTLGRKPQELVAPSGCCLGSGIDTRRSERVGSSKQGYNDQTHFARLFSLSLVTGSLLVLSGGAATQRSHGGCVVQLQFQMVCDRPPVAFGGSPPHGGGEWRNLPLVRGRRERGGRSHIIWNCS